MRLIEYWTIDSEDFTASGTHRFVKATLAPVHGVANLAVEFDEDCNIVGVALLKASEENVSQIQAG